jgi:histone H3/H4
MAEEEITTILKSMGVDNADPMVAVALQECASRFASTLLCDSKDYASHAGHPDIDVGDAKMAIAMADLNIMSHDPRQKVVIEQRSAVNNIDLVKACDDKAWVHRYPKDPTMVDPTKTLLQRTYTIVPSTEALPQQQHLGEHRQNQTDFFQPMKLST